MARRSHLPSNRRALNADPEAVARVPVRDQIREKDQLRQADQLKTAKQRQQFAAQAAEFSEVLKLIRAIRRAVNQSLTNSSISDEIKKSISSEINRSIDPFRAALNIYLPPRNLIERPKHFSALIDSALSKRGLENAELKAVVEEVVSELLSSVPDATLPTRDIPETAPALWASDKQPSVSPPEFIKRHYEPWLGKGLARPDIKRLDPQLYVALSNWLRKNEMPADLDLPTLKERNDRWVSKVGEGGEAEAALREARRLVRTAERRQR